MRFQVTSVHCLQHVTAYFTAVDLDTIRPLTLKAWVDCHPIGAPIGCEHLMTSASEQSGELFVYAIDSWKGGHVNRILMQLFDAQQTLLAQVVACAACCLIEQLDECMHG